MSKLYLPIIIHGRDKYEYHAETIGLFSKNQLREACVELAKKLYRKGFCHFCDETGEIDYLDTYGPGFTERPEVIKYIDSQIQIPITLIGALVSIRRFAEYNNDGFCCEDGWKIDIRELDTNNEESLSNPENYTKIELTSK